MSASVQRMHMEMAISLASTAAKLGKRPFGCIITKPGEGRIGWGSGSETPTDPTAHSEIAAIRMACQRVGGLLHGCTLYSTLEPCTMCLGAIVHSKVSAVVFGAYRGDRSDLFRSRSYRTVDILRDTTVPVEVYGGVLHDECVELLQFEDRWRKEFAC